MNGLPYVKGLDREKAKKLAGFVKSNPGCTLKEINEADIFNLHYNISYALSKMMEAKALVRTRESGKSRYFWPEDAPKHIPFCNNLRKREFKKRVEKHENWGFVQQELSLALGAFMPAGSSPTDQVFLKAVIQAVLDKTKLSDQGWDITF